MILKLFLLFTTMSLVELALLIWIGRYLGVLVTIALVILTAILGASMAKFEGTRIWIKLNRQLARGEIPGDTLLEGAVIFVGGLTFLTPGFITDTLGLLCLIPPARRLFCGWIKQWIKKKLRSGHTVHFNWNSGTSPPSGEAPIPIEPEDPDTPD